MADRIRQWLTFAGVAIVIAGVVGWRSLRKPGVATPRPGAATGGVAVPSADLAPLMAYAAPLPDSALSLAGAPESVAVRRDPFGEEPSAVPASPHVERRAREVDASQWHVSATLIAGARRAAVINDALVYEGDAIPGGGKLTSVERDRVVVTDPQGATHTVTVKEGDG